MITNKLSKDAKRPGATCLNCECLNHSTDPCLLRGHILAKTYTVTNYAGEGCTKFRGEWVSTIKPVKHQKNKEALRALRKRLMNGEEIKKSLCPEYGLTFDEVMRFIHRFRKSYPVTIKKINNDTIYFLNEKS